MLLIPYEKYKLQTVLTPEEVHSRLKKCVESTASDFRSLFQNASVKPYIGKVSHQAFRIRRAIMYRNSFLPVVSGKFEATADGANVYITMKLPTPVLVFTLAWISAVAFAGAFFCIHQIISGTFGPEASVALLFLVFGYGLTITGFKYESNKTRIFFTSLLKDKMY